VGQLVMKVSFHKRQLQMWKHILLRNILQSRTKVLCFICSVSNSSSSVPGHEIDWRIRNGCVLLCHDHWVGVLAHVKMLVPSSNLFRILEAVLHIGRNCILIYYRVARLSLALRQLQHQFGQSSFW